MFRRGLAGVLIVLGGCSTAVESPTGDRSLAVEVDAPSPITEGNPAFPSDPVEVGFIATSAGDVNRDGFDDVLVTSPKELGGTNNGSAWVHHGDAGGVSTTHAWTSVGLGDEELGAAAAWVGDVNGDGFADIAIGSPGHTGVSGAQSGRVQVFCGSPTGIDLGVCNFDVLGQGAGHRLGASVAPLGDRDGDGDSEFAVGAPGYDGSHPDTGAIFVFTGDPSGPNVGPEINPGISQDDRIGTVLAAVGDVDGSGTIDLVTANPEWDGLRGKAWLHLSEPSSLGGGIQHFQGEAPGDGFGTSVAALGDVSGDGYADVAIGAPYFDSDDIGKIYIYLGSPSPDPLSPFGDLIGSPPSLFGIGASVQGLGDTNGDGRPDFAFSRAGNDPSVDNHVTVVHMAVTMGVESEFGDCTHDFSHVGKAGDFDGDGFTDMVLGSQHWGPTGCGDSTGRVRWYPGGAEGPTDSPTWGPFSGNGGDRMGAALANAGDFNGDGYDDLIIGLPEADQLATDAGAVGLWLGGPEGLELSPDGELQPPTSVLLETGDEYGAALAGLGDINGDGYEDVVVGAPGSLIAGADQGAAYVFLGQDAPGPVIAAEDVVPGVGPGARFGEAVAGLGDVDGDGWTELMITSPGASGGGGQAEIFSWDGSGLTSTWLVNSSGNDALGAAAAGADVNGDGFSDVIIGVPGADAPGEPGIDHGGVFVYFGGPQFETLGPPFPETHYGPTAGALLGSTVARIGDVNGDQWTDFIAGAPDYSGSSLTQSGYVAVLAGQPGGFELLTEIEGPGDFAHFGSAVSAAGDIDRDGYADFAIGAPSNLGGDGLAQIVFGGSSLATEWSSTGTNNENHGAALAAGDFDGDGFPDLAVGAPLSDGDAGSVTVSAGGRGEYGAPPRLPLNIRARQTDGAPLPPWGLVDASGEFEVVAENHSPMGRAPTALQVEIREAGELWTGHPDDIYEAPPLDLAPGTPAQLHAATLSGLDPGAAYQWRARLSYDLKEAPLMPHSPWVYGGLPGDRIGAFVRVSEGGGGDDDDDTGPDDDDATGPGVLTMTIEFGESDVFPTINAGQQYSIDVNLANSGGELLQGSIVLNTPDSPGVWTIPGTAATIFLAPGTDVDVPLTFAPLIDGDYEVDFEGNHDGSNPSPQVITFTAQAGAGAGETNCTDTIDNDGDGDIDCDDADCGGDPACNPGADFCCFPGDSATYLQCADAAGSTCVCAIDSFCCSISGGWDATCVGIYQNDCGVDCS